VSLSLNAVAFTTPLRVFFIVSLHAGLVSPKVLFSSAFGQTRSVTYIRIYNFRAGYPQPHFSGWIQPRTESEKLGVTLHGSKQRRRRRCSKNGKMQDEAKTESFTALHSHSLCFRFS
jgi:hypothetical protein